MTVTARRSVVTLGLGVALLHGARATAQGVTTERASAEGAAVEVRGRQEARRGVGDIRVSRELFTASPRQHTSELLSAAPGFFVDHEDGEGLGNDVYLRGWDLEHGSGIEMGVGGLPVNQPLHVRGQGYADVNFVIPEVVRGVHVLEGPYHPAQGDAAIVGSAHFDLGMAERGYQVGASYGSFAQKRLVAVAAPDGLDDESFLAVALRETDGFGDDREARSASANAQYGVDLGPSSHVRILGIAHGVRGTLPGVVRQDDVRADRIGYYDRYPYFSDNQSIGTSRAGLAVAFDHVTAPGGRLAVTPWVMWTDFRARQNYAGALETSQIDPTRSGLGDLFETANDEVAAGLEGSFTSARERLGTTELVLEPGVSLRVGDTGQSKNLLVPDTREVWDRRLDVRMTTVDAGAYVDLDVRLWKRVRLSGGPRADLLVVSLDDRLAGSTPPGGVPLAAHRNAVGVAVSPRVTCEYEALRTFSLAVSYGEGFRSLDPGHLTRNAVPYSKVRSVEAGLRAEDGRSRYRTTLALFNTWVGNELVFVAEEGGFETESASTRRGVTGSFLARPYPWLLGSFALSVTDAVFTTRVPGVSHHVPNVPPLLFRTDVTVRGRLASVQGTPLTGKVGAGYTFLSGRHLTDAIIGPTSNILNAGAGLRYGAVELDLDVYNALGREYADTADVYISNWSLRPGQQPASVATHLTAAPPRSVVGTVRAYW